MSADSSLTGQSTLVSALVGAVVTVVVSFVPLSPLLGGGVAGYLRGGDRSEGLRVGAISGAIAAIPILGVLLVVFSVLTVFSISAGTARGGVLFVVILVVGVVVSLVYSAGLSALGGYVGVMLLEREGSGPGSRGAAEAARERRASSAANSAGSTAGADSGEADDDGAHETDDDPDRPSA